MKGINFFSRHEKVIKKPIALKEQGEQIQKERIGSQSDFFFLPLESIPNNPTAVNQRALATVSWDELWLHI